MWLVMCDPPCDLWDPPCGTHPDAMWDPPGRTHRVTCHVGPILLPCGTHPCKQINKGRKWGEWESNTRSHSPTHELMTNRPQACLCQIYASAFLYNTQNCWAWALVSEAIFFFCPMLSELFQVGRLAFFGCIFGLGRVGSADFFFLFFSFILFCFL